MKQPDTPPSQRIWSVLPVARDRSLRNPGTPHAGHRPGRQRCLGPTADGSPPPRRAVFSHLSRHDFNGSCGAEATGLHPPLSCAAGSRSRRSCPLPMACSARRLLRGSKAHHGGIGRSVAIVRSFRRYRARDGSPVHPEAPWRHTIIPGGTPQ